MATERAAEQARKMHAKALLALNAHAIEVGPILRAGKRTFGVIAYFKQRPKNVPKELPVDIDGKRVNVPVSVRIASPFVAE